MCVVEWSGVWVWVVVRVLAGLVVLLAVVVVVLRVVVVVIAVVVVCLVVKWCGWCASPVARVNLARMARPGMLCVCRG